MFILSPQWSNAESSFMHCYAQHITRIPDRKDVKIKNLPTTDHIAERESTARIDSQ